MSIESVAMDLVLVAGEEHGATRIAEDTVKLDELNLFVQVRTLQAMSVGTASAFTSEITASEQAGSAGITITCVGKGEGMEDAVKDAVGQWCVGVLPVLAHWRGKHSCLSAPRRLQTRSGVFDLLAGPTLLRDYSGAEPKPESVGEGFASILQPLLERASQARRAHWLEMFASKMADGSVEATCRVNNHDWLTATRTLTASASTWSPTGSPMVSQRQFAMLMPAGMEAQRIVLPTFWERMLGRA